MIPLVLDLSKPEDIGRFCSEVKELLRRNGLALGGLVNGAAIEHHGPLEILPFDWLRLEMEVGFFGMLRLTRGLLPELRRHRGRIVNMSSVHGRSAARSVGSSCATKYAIEGATDTLRMELRKWGMEISLIEPGPVATPLWDKALDAFAALRTAVPTDVLADYYPDFAAAVGRARADNVRSARWACPPDSVAAASADDSNAYFAGVVGWQLQSVAGERQTMWLPWLVYDGTLFLIARSCRQVCACGNRTRCGSM